MWNNLFFSFKPNFAYTSQKVDNVTLLLGLTALVFIVYVLRGRKKYNLPPGPIGLPILGYYFPFKRKPLETLEKLTKKYGNVFGLHIGPKYVVFLNDWEAAKDALSQNKTLDRPDSVFTGVPYRFGLGGTNGEEWVEIRRVSSKAMKDGLKVNHWEDLIEMELRETVKLVAQQDEKPIELRSFFGRSFSNNVLSLILGDRNEIKQSITNMVTISVNFIMENSSLLNMINYSPTLYKYLMMLGVEKSTDIGQKAMDLGTFVSDTVESSIKNPNQKESFISRFHQEVSNRNKIQQKTYITDDTLKGTVLALVVGGSETTRSSVSWALIAMADHPDMQEKVHEELNNAIGSEGFIRWSNRAKVPYTLAILLESMRMWPAGPVSTLRMVTEDTQIQGYSIPKGTILIPNIWCMHHDPKYWPHPEEFIPERFLLEDGQKVNMAPESYMPFSYGKRNCPGKLLALMDMLQYFSALMLRFKVVPKEGDKVKYNAVLGLSYQARNAELRFIPR